MWLLVLFIGLGTSGLAACAARPSGEPFRPEVVDPGRAVIYIFREPRNLRSPPMRVVVDQRPVGRLRAGAYIPVVVEPGSHLVRVEGLAEASREVAVEPGGSAYLRIGTPRVRRRLPVIDEPDPDTGRRLIAETIRADADDAPPEGSHQHDEPGA